MKTKAAALIPLLCLVSSGLAPGHTTSARKLTRTDIVDGERTPQQGARKAPSCYASVRAALARRTRLGRFLSGKNSRVASVRKRGPHEVELLQGDVVASLQNEVLGTMNTAANRGGSSVMNPLRGFPGEGSGVESVDATTNAEAGTTSSEAARFCTRCGEKRHQPTSNFCGRCGTEFEVLRPAQSSSENSKFALELDGVLRKVEAAFESNPQGGLTPDPNEFACAPPPCGWGEPVLLTSEARGSSTRPSAPPLLTSDVAALPYETDVEQTVDLDLSLATIRAKKQQRKQEKEQKAKAREAAGESRGQQAAKELASKLQYQNEKGTRAQGYGSPAGGWRSRTGDFRYNFAALRANGQMPPGAYAH